MKNLAIALLAVLTGESVYAKTTADIRAELTKLLAHSPTVTNARQIKQLKLESGASLAQPWSGSFWPDITGSIANHYRDRSTFANQVTFLLRYDVAKKRVWNDFKKVQKNYLTWDSDRLNRKLSPSEKYDLLIGNQNFEFTQAIIEELEFRSENKKTWIGSRSSDEEVELEGDDNHDASRFDSDRRVNGHYVYQPRAGGFPYWSGICDGWSPASIYLPRPLHPVTIESPSGLPITFYPDDIKALGTYLFARTNTPYFATMNYAFAGKACRQKGKPDRDNRGMINDRACNDVDAGLWHLTLVNRLGVDRTGFVMDIDNNQKINNHPVFSYDLKYFNPITGREGSLSQSIVPRSAMTDPYRAYRDPKAVSIVGVRSSIRYSYYVWAEQNKDVVYDSPANDKVKELEYTYDLELDADGNILGGEWGDRSREDESVRFAKQPDFIWMSPLRQRPYSQMSLSTLRGDFFGDRFVWAWNGKGTIPEDWLMAAKLDQQWAPPAINDQYAKLKSAQVLSNLVYVLFDLAQ